MSHNDIENIENRTTNNINISLDDNIIIQKANKKAVNAERRPFSQISGCGDSSQKNKFRNSKKPKDEENNYH